MTINLNIFKITSEFFEENGYIANVPGNNNAVVFDPGSDVDKFFDYLSKNKLLLKFL